MTGCSIPRYETEGKICMKKFSGKGVNDAVAIGNVSVFKRGKANVSRTVTDDPEGEIKRVEAAREKAIGVRSGRSKHRSLICT